MAAGFVKVAADLDSNPKIRRAGRAGREVFLFVLRRTNLQERDGRCSLSNVEPWYLADQLQMPETEAADGLQRAIAAGLLAIDDGQVVVCGWDDEWAKRPAEGAERTERWRNKRRLNQASARSRPVTVTGDEVPVASTSPPVPAAAPASATSSPVTEVASPSVTERHGDESDGSDQIRSDQIRVDHWENAPSAHRDTSHVTEVTSPNVTERHGDESDGSDQIRLDQIRVDHWESAPSAPSNAALPAACAHRKPKASRAPRSVSLPADWSPRGEELALARTLRLDPTVEAASFRDHHSAKGTRFVDWEAAFRNWLRNAVKFNRGNARPDRPSFFEILDSLPCSPPTEVHS